MTAYETDISAWALEQAELLRRRAINELDWDNLAIEIKVVSATQKKEIRKCLKALCEYLIKWQYHPELRCRKDKTKINNKRDRLTDCLEANPSLRPYAVAALSRVYTRVQQADTDLLSLPTDAPFTLDQVMDPTFTPGGGR